MSLNRLVKTDAIVLKTIRFRESSKIITFYTKDYGKISGIVKGAFRRKILFGNALEPMSYVSVVFYLREKRNIQVVSECSIIKPYRSMYTDIQKMAVGLAIVELINNVVRDGDKNLPLFNLMVDSLFLIDGATKNVQNMLYFFELKATDFLGFKPSFIRCIQCKRLVKYKENQGQVILYNIDKGAPLCSECSKTRQFEYKMAIRCFQVLKNLWAIKDWNKIFTLYIDAQTKREIEKFLFDYFKFHKIGLWNLRSKRVFEQIAQINE